MLKKIFAIIIVIILIFQVNLITFATTITDKLEQKKQEAQEQKEEVSEQKSDIMKEVEKLSDSILENEDKLLDINDKLVKLNKEIEELKKELQETQEKYIEQEDFLKEKLVIQYEAGKTTYLDVLLNSKGILQFISNYYLVSEVLQNDSDLLNSIEEQKNKIEKDKKTLEENQKKVKIQKIEQEKINVILSNQKTQKENKVSQLSNKEKDIQKQIDEYNRLIRQEEIKIRNASVNANDKYTFQLSGSGILAWPLPSSYGTSRITSGFGARSAPVAGASTYHRAIDIGIPIGTPVYSAADGYVVITGYSSIRGNYVMVKHASNLYTFYQHLNSVSTSAGSNVKKGQTIAYSGNTGIGSGPHLHFEVRTSSNYGSEVNPLNYL